MRYLERKPPIELEPYVKCFWYLNRTYDKPNDGELLWPDGCYEMIFHFGESYEVNNTVMESAFLIGSLTHYHQLKAKGSIRLFGVRLKPWGLKAFVDTDVKILKDQFVPLNNIFPRTEMEIIEEKLRDLEFEEGLSQLTESMNRLLDTERLDMPFIEVLSRLYDDPIHQDIQTIVSMSNYSQRQFERKGVELTGISPKKLSKVARFNHVRLRIFWNPEIDLLDCMNEFGYYDYAHFSKDFKECIGLTPKEYKQWMLDKKNCSNKPKKNVVFLQDE